MKRARKRLAPALTCAFFAWCFTGCGKPLLIPSLPEPPQQHSVWTPPLDSPSNLVSIARTLFDQGLPDPRGCEYREVEISVSSSCGSWEKRTPTVHTHGWALNRTGASNFVLCWNGVVYHAEKVGPIADLDRDLQLLPTNSLFHFNQAFSEMQTVFPSNAPPQAALLLLRLGKSAAATRLEEANSQTHNRSRQYGDKNDDQYLDLASDWAWSMFDHLISAHIRGDVSSALPTARKLIEVQPQIEKEAAIRGFELPSDYSSNPFDKTKTQSYLTFLKDVPKLVFDLERREQNPKTNSIIDRGLSPTNTKPQDITALIEDLDMVNESQMGQPGWVVLDWDPIVKAIINIGDSAVDPLIICLANDKRLTRSVGFHRNFFRDRHVIPVRSAALAALQRILRVQFQTPGEFRQYWSENRGRPIEERWYATLKDDTLTPDQWLQAARSIMQPENIEGVPGGTSSMEAPLKPGQKERLRGEILRRKTNPSVTELLVKRANEAAAEVCRERAGGPDAWALRPGLEFVSILGKWDNPSNAAPAANTLMRCACAMWLDPHTFYGSSGHDLAQYIPQLANIRIKGGDTNAWPEYIQWVTNAEPEKTESYAMDAFGIFTNHLDSQRAMVACDWLFNSQSSPWSKLPWKRVAFYNPIESDLIVIPAFRQMLIRELDNKTPIGTMGYSAKYNSVTYDFGTSSGSRGPWPTPNKPADGATAKVRQCDFIAWSLLNAKRITDFNPFASEAERDTMIATIQQTLKTWPQEAARANP